MDHREDDRPWLVIGGPDDRRKIKANLDYCEWCNIPTQTPQGWGLTVYKVYHEDRILEFDPEKNKTLKLIGPG